MWPENCIFGFLTGKGKCKPWDAFFLKLDRNKFGSGLSDICTARGLWVFSWLNPFLRFFALGWASLWSCWLGLLSRKKCSGPRTWGSWTRFVRESHIRHIPITTSASLSSSAQGSLPLCPSMSLSKLPQREEDFLGFIFYAEHKWNRARTPQIYSGWFKCSLKAQAKNRKTPRNL